MRQIVHGLDAFCARLDIKHSEFAMDPTQIYLKMLLGESVNRESYLSLNDLGLAGNLSQKALARIHFWVSKFEMDLGWIYLNPLLHASKPFQKHIPKQKPF